MANKPQPTRTKKKLANGKIVTVVSVPKSPNIRPVKSNVEYEPPRPALVRSPQPYARIANTKWGKSKTKSKSKDSSSG